MWFRSRDKIGVGFIPNRFFAAAGELLDPYLATFGFKFQRDDFRKGWHAGRLYRKGEQYIVVSTDVNQYDGAPWGNAGLGVGDDAFPEGDWNKIALWRLAERTGPPKAAQYNVDGWTPEQFFTAVRADLERYAREFLTGDLAQFLAVRAKQNSAREPYMVYAPDPSGAYAKSPEPGSENLKERYSKPE